MALGCILGSYSMERSGRKNAQYLGALAALIGWIIVYFAENVPVLLVGRFCKGLSNGIVAPPTTVYVGEATEPRYRGFFLGALMLALSIGILFSHFLGTVFSWRTAALLNAIVPVVAFVLLIFAPESPSWLTKKGKLEKAERKFLWCRGHSTQAKDEVAAMLKRQMDEGGSRSLKDLLKGRFLRPLSIIIVFLVTTQFTGVNVIAFYSVAIIQDIVGDGLNEYTAMLIVDILRVISSLIACILLRKMGRRPLALSSGIGCTISLIALAFFIYLPNINPSFSKYSSISIVFLMGYVFFVTVGITPLPWAMVGELFPLNAREYGSGIASSTAFLAMFAVIKSSPYMFSTIGASGTFLVYGCVALGETVFLGWVLPETKNKTLQEVEDMFRTKKKVQEVDEKIGMV